MALVCSCGRGPGVSGSRGVLWCRCSCCWLSAAHVEVRVLAQAAGFPVVHTPSFGTALVSVPRCWSLSAAGHTHPPLGVSGPFLAAWCAEAAAVHTSTFGAALVSAPCCWSFSAAGYTHPPCPSLRPFLAARCAEAAAVHAFSIAIGTASVSVPRCWSFAAAALSHSGLCGFSFSVQMTANGTIESWF